MSLLRFGQMYVLPGEGNTVVMPKRFGADRGSDSVRDNHLSQSVWSV